MIVHRNLALIASLPLALTAACASSPDDYPSLALREAERVAGSFAPAAPAPLPPPAPMVLEEADALAAAAAGAHAAFMAEAPDATALVSAARGAATGSESWARAEVALASLVSARSRTMIALADLDRLYVAAAVEGATLDRLGDLRDGVEAQVDEENAAIDELTAVHAP